MFRTSFGKFLLVSDLILNVVAHKEGKGRKHDVEWHRQDKPHEEFSAVDQVQIGVSLVVFYRIAVNEFACNYSTSTAVPQEGTA